VLWFEVPAFRPREIAWSPQRDRLAFHGYYVNAAGEDIHGVFVSEVDAVQGVSQPRLLVRNADWPRWSPDGEYLAYVQGYRDADGNGRQRLGVISAEGGPSRVLVDDVHVTNPPAWAPEEID
jgi:Tol biopolymer transport system component